MSEPPNDPLAPCYDLTESAQTEVFPITRIGVETVLSKMPIHNLAKKGRINIQITRHGSKGEIDVKWEVSYNERYGQPRQLAYKLDTIIINRRVDEEGRPLPRFIRLGTLNELCEELRSQKNELKRAIRQNATTSINAKLKYRGNDGSERELEALFTRYSVYFTGEKLPDGRVADAVYIELNGPYREVLNNAPIRPLNYQYLKSLPPAPQRFYELVSARIYAAQKNKNSFAKILYSEFCTYSALTRHYDYENFRVQMAKIHRPHLKSGYIAKVHYEETVDAEGQPDWMMCYQPGGRARAEYMTFARKSKQLDATFETIEELEPVPQPTALVPTKPLKISQRPQNRVTLSQRHSRMAAADPLLLELTQRGISERKSREILSNLREGQQVLDQLEWGDYLIHSDPAKFRSPAGFYVYLLTENVAPPQTFETSRQKKTRRDAESHTESEYTTLLRLQNEYEDYRSGCVESFIQSQLPDRELAAITAQKRKHLEQACRSFHLMSPDTVKSMVWGAVKAEIYPRVTFLTFEEFLRQRETQPSLFSVLPGGSSEAGLGSQPGDALESQETPLRASGTRQGGTSLPQVKPTPQKADFGQARDDKGSGSPRSLAAQGLGVDEATLLERYEEFRRNEAMRALEGMEPSQRSRQMKMARAFLLNEHPNREHHQHLIADEQYNEFHRLSEQQLLSVILENLKLPGFEDWKRYALSAITGKK